MRHRLAATRALCCSEGGNAGSSSLSSRSAMVAKRLAVVGMYCMSAPRELGRAALEERGDTLAVVLGLEALLHNFDVHLEMVGHRAFEAFVDQLFGEPDGERRPDEESPGL